MIGKVARVCDVKCCTCNEASTAGRRRLKRLAKRRERAALRRAADKELSSI